MGAPTIEWVRPGVGFVPDAAASFRRIESQVGRRVDVNSSYRDYAKQMSMYAAWLFYMRGGPYPGHGKAVHPDQSDHCKGLAFDTDDWAVLGRVFIENGWRRTDPSENWHWVYQARNDRYYGQPAGSGSVTTPAVSPSARLESEGSMRVITLTFLNPQENWIVDREYLALVPNEAANRQAIIYNPGARGIGASEWDWNVQLDILGIGRDWASKAKASGSNWWSRDREIQDAVERGNGNAA